MLFGQNIGKNNPYIQYAPNDDGPTPSTALKETCLIEYYTELPARNMLDTVGRIHNVLCEEFIQEELYVAYAVHVPS